MDGSFYTIIAFSGENTLNIGILLYDSTSDSLHIKFRADYDTFGWIDEGDTEVLSYIADDLANKASELGPLQLIEYLEENCSNSLLISERVAIPSLPSAQVAVIDSLFNLHVAGQDKSLYQTQTGG